MICPICRKGQLKRDTRSVLFSYHGVTVEIDQPGDWCDACGEGVLSAADMAATATVRHDAIVRAKERLAKKEHES